MIAGSDTGMLRTVKKSGFLTLRSLSATLFITLFFLAGPGGASAWDGSAPLIIDHNCTDLSGIPQAWIDSAKVHLKMHYAHTSHGSQLTHGVDTIESYDSFYSVNIGRSFLPDEAGAFCIFRGQESRTYVEPHQYWETEAGMNETRDVLTNNPQISVSMFAWCTQLSSASEEYVQAYLDSMMQLEAEFPNVTFVYMTGNAQSQGAAVNRCARNNQIRQHCIDNNKVLFDFADLDCWWLDPDTQEWEYSTFTDYWGDEYPYQHPQFESDELAHTTVESCVQKGRALWWMVAVLSGWPAAGPNVTEDIPGAISGNVLDQNYPNPFNPSTTITFALKSDGFVNLSVYNAAGQLVAVLIDESRPAGPYAAVWNGKAENGASAASGVYFYRLITKEFEETKKMILLR